MGTGAVNVVIHEVRPRPKSSQRGPLRDYIIMAMTVVTVIVLLAATFPAPSRFVVDERTLLFINAVILTVVGYLAVWKIRLARTWYVSLAELSLYYGMFVLGPWEHLWSLAVGYIIVQAVHRRLPAIAQRDRLGAFLTFAVAWALKLSVLDRLNIPEVAAVLIAGLLGGAIGDAVTLIWISWDEGDWHYLAHPLNHLMAIVAHIPQLVMLAPVVWLTDRFHGAALGCTAAATLLVGFRTSQRRLGRQIAATDAFDAATEVSDITPREILEVFVQQLASLALADVVSATVVDEPGADCPPPAQMQHVWHTRELRVPAGPDHTLVVHMGRYRGTHGLFSHSIMALARQLSVRAGTRWQLECLVAEATWHAEHDAETGLADGVGLGKDLAASSSADGLVALLRSNARREMQVDSQHLAEHLDALLATASYLKDVAKQLPDGKLYRTGDNTFAISFRGKNCHCLIREMTKLRPTRREDLELPTFSIGYARRTPNGDDDLLSPMEQLRRAQTALIAAEVQGVEHPVEYNADLDELNSSRSVMRNELERALERDELELFFQPQIDSVTGRVFGLEALARWNHQRLGVVTPDVFVPLAEESMLMPLMTEAVLRKGARACKAWQTFAPGVRLSVNISVSSVLRDTFLADLLRIIEQEGVSPTLITLELTESVLMEDTGQGERLLSKMRAFGFEVSLDDFGTGYSSLAALHDLPVDEVKIDRSFVVEANNSQGGMTVLRHIVSLMRRLQVRMVAEGVEDLAMVRTLQGMGCRIIQGYCYARPMPYNDLLGWFQRFRASESAVSSRPGQREPVVPPG